MINSISYEFFDEMSEWPLAYAAWEIEGQLAELVGDRSRRV